VIEESSALEGRVVLLGDAAGPGLWIREEFLRADWVDQGGGIWRAQRRLGGTQDRGPFAPRLVQRDIACTHLPEHYWGGGFLALSPARDATRLLSLIATETDLPAFCCPGDELFLVLQDGQHPPQSAELTTFLSFGEVEGDDWFVSIGHVRATGLPVLPGVSQELRCTVPPDSVLRFHTATAGGHGSGTMTFRIRSEGVVLFEFEQHLATQSQVRSHTLSLEPGASVPLSFEVAGPLRASAFLSPIIGPADPGRYGARPWTPERPDIVLFVADTFRADNLAAWGGAPEITPHLNRLAQESVLFIQTRAPSTWTYPSHASLFAGLYPYQANATDPRTSLPDQAHTLAEHLRAAGYRTVAVTERGYCSRRYGLAQGFEWFEEQRDGIELTLSRTREVLAADDGRPLFLFVHSYRAHHPYQVTQATRLRLGIEGEFQALTDRLNQMKLPRQWSPNDHPQAESTVRALETLYRGASADLDVGFGRLRELLENHGLLPGAFLIVTSDHGEAFSEHGAMRHGKGVGVWDEILRVPLLIHGPDLGHREVLWPVTLVDLAPTVAALAGLDPFPGWVGEDLLRLERDRPLFAFQCARTGFDDVAWLRGGRKLILRGTVDSTQPGKLVRAYDLVGDPQEGRNLLPSAAWPEELRADLSRLAEWSVEELFDPQTSTTDSTLEQQLKALGYGGDDEEQE